MQNDTYEAKRNRLRVEISIYMVYNEKSNGGVIPMVIDFHAIQEMTIPGMNNGTGTMSARMYMDEHGKIIPCKIHPGGAIGTHKHETSDDINDILSGTGKAVCDGEEEILAPGACHICRKGSAHSIINTGAADLVMLTIVVER